MTAGHFIPLPFPRLAVRQFSELNKMFYVAEPHNYFATRQQLLMIAAARTPDWFVAGGTIGLAVVTFLLVLQTRGSVRDANEQIKLERNRLEAAQWPRVFPAPSGEWISRQGPVQRSGLVERPTRQERRPGGCTERLRATRLHESGRTDGRAHPVKPRSRRSGGSPARMAATPPSALIAGGSGQAEGTVAAKLDTLSRKKR